MRTAFQQACYGADDIRDLLTRPQDYTGPRYTGFRATVATEALLVHWAECCTRAAPCVTAALFILATGQAGQTSGRMVRDDNRATGIEDAPRGTGKGAGGARAPRTVLTDRQAAFVAGLADQITAAAAGIAHGDTFTAVLGELTAELEMTGEFAGKRPTRDRVSWVIGALKQLRDGLWALQRKQWREAGAAAAEQLEVNALYRHPEEGLFIIRESAAGRRYALAVITEDSQGEPCKPYTDWAGGRGMLPKLTADMRADAEWLAHLGRKIGFCMFCLKVLTNQASKRHGYGPICAENQGLPYGD